MTTSALAAPAWAHVEAELSTVSDTGRAEVSFSFHHGCDGEATTALRIQTPAAVTDVTLEPHQGFTSNVSDTEFGWSGGSVPDGEEATFTATVQLSGQEGDVVAFPTIQQCGDTEAEDWIDDPAAGDSSDETEHPAPSIVLPATYATPGADAPTTASSAPTGLVTTTTLADNATPETSESNTAGLVVFVVIVVVLVGGAAYLIVSNRRPRPPAPAPEDSPDDGPDGGPDDRGGRRSPH